MLPSGNDAAQAISECLGSICFKKLKYSDPETYRRLSLKNLANFSKFFVDEMNNNAELLGLFSTNFANPHGLMNKFNQSSALDVALITQEGSYRYETFRQVIRTK
jgi:D-alanyl-D-alanine carboxypeptidase